MLSKCMQVCHSFHTRQHPLTSLALKYLGVLSTPKHPALLMDMLHISWEVVVTYVATEVTTPIV